MSDVRRAAKFISDLYPLMGADDCHGSTERRVHAAHGVIELLSAIYDKEFRQVDADVNNELMGNLSERR